MKCVHKYVCELMILWCIIDDRLSTPVNWLIIDEVGAIRSMWYVSANWSGLCPWCNWWTLFQQDLQHKKRACSAAIVKIWLICTILHKALNCADKSNYCDLLIAFINSIKYYIEKLTLSIFGILKGLLFLYEKLQFSIGFCLCWASGG